jgi:hypothetical protein
MRSVSWIALLVCVASCTKREPAPAAPVVAVVVDAAPAPPIDAPVVVDAAPARLVLTRDGIGPLQRLAWAKQNEQKIADVIQDALEPLLPGIATRFDVLDVPGEVETEEGYWSVKRGETELVMVLRDHSTDEPRPVVMIVWTPDIPTEDGTKVGDSVATVLAKHPKLACANHPQALIVGTVGADATCEDKDAPGVLYVLDARKRKLPRGALTPSKIKDVSIVALVGMPK